MEWAQMACHRCLVYLGDLGKSSSIIWGGFYTKRMAPIRAKLFEAWHSSRELLAVLLGQEPGFVRKKELMGVGRRSGGRGTGSSLQCALTSGVPKSGVPAGL